jgi:hypothetical protein
MFIFSRANDAPAGGNLALADAPESLAAGRAAFAQASAKPARARAKLADGRAQAAHAPAKLAGAPARAARGRAGLAAARAKAADAGDDSKSVWDKGAESRALPGREEARWKLTIYEVAGNAEDFGQRLRIRRDMPEPSDAGPYD